MDHYVTEDQQVEAIKTWWKENGSSVLIGSALGLVLVFAVRTWNDWQANKSEAAARIYQQVEAGLKTNQTITVQQAGTRLVEEYPSSVYAILGALAEAAALVEKGDLAGARGRLEWAITQGSDPHLKALAQLRLGRLILDQGDFARALTLSEAAAAAGFQAEADELRGDVLRTQGDRAGARAAYQAALSKLSPSSGVATNLRLKLDDLGKEA
ncbi:Ancillary SecYEG translocon subunit [Gammaproteobacteria bacterium]